MLMVHCTTQTGTKRGQKLASAHALHYLILLSEYLVAFWGLQKSGGVGEVQEFGSNLD